MTTVIVDLVFLLIACAANASSVLTPMAGTSSANAKALAVETPVRTPVNDPGPILMAIRSI